jgi:DNA-directed RNA polymerase specialized sigma24 family protein
LTPAETEEVIVRYKDGATIRELALAFAVHRTTVMALLDRQGMPRRGNGRKLTDDDVAKAARLYASSLSLAEVAERFNVTARTVREGLVKAGERIRPRRGC